MIIFVDCDDTLVLWRDYDIKGEFDEWSSDKYVPNHDLIELLNILIEYSSELSVVVWTGGGKNYAKLWKQRLLPAAHSAMPKGLVHTYPGDIIIDDIVLGDKLVGDATLITPEDFIEQNQVWILRMEG